MSTASDAAASAAITDAPADSASGTTARSLIPDAAAARAAYEQLCRPYEVFYEEVIAPAIKNPRHYFQITDATGYIGFSFVHSFDADPFHEWLRMKLYDDALGWETTCKPLENVSLVNGTVVSISLGSKSTG